MKLMFGRIRNLFRDKKGFTLVELIVVLVILGILAALLVPALTGYLDKANAQKVKATTRQVVLAAQTLISEDYAKNGPYTADGVISEPLSTSAENNTCRVTKTEIARLAEVNESVVTSVSYTKAGMVSKVLVSDGKNCVYVKAAAGDTGAYYVEGLDDQYNTYSTSQNGSSSGSPSGDE